MEYDAFSAGVKPGGLVSRDEIKILICHILAKIGKAVPERQMKETLHFEGIANFFEVGDAIQQLYSIGHLSREDSDGEEMYRITDSGLSISQTLYRSIPLSTRERAVEAIEKMLSRHKIEKETKIEITKAGAGYMISCSFMEGETELMTLRLQLPTAEEAYRVKDHFLENAVEIYIKTTALMTDYQM